MIARNAAALLGGAAAVHLAEIAFHAGTVAGLAGGDHGRALLLAMIALPAIAFALAAWDRAVGGWVFLLGAGVGYAVDEWFLLPTLGFGWSSLVWLGPWVLARAARRRGGKEAAAPLPGTVLPIAVAALLGVAAGFAFAALRPFLLQHVNGTRSGIRIAVATALLGLLAGAALGHATKRRMSRVGLAVLGAVFAALGGVTTWLLLPRASAGLTLPFISGAWSLTWWGRSVLASWAMMGLGTVAFGILASLCDRRLAMPFLIVGLCLGTWAGERFVVGLSRDPAAARALADKVARHPPMQRIEAAAIGPDGIWTRYRTRTLLDIESVGFWQATRMDRGSLWRNLEAAEVEPAKRGPSGPPVWRGEWGPVDTLWPSFGFLAADFTLRDRVGWLRDVYLPADAECEFRDWCDPRALTPAGLRSLLGTWREALPHATFLVLIDGYSGPLLGFRVAHNGTVGEPRTVAERFPIATQLTLFEAPIGNAFRRELGPASTSMRPILEWETAPEPSPFIHPTAPVMRALEQVLAIDPASAIGRILRGLVIHAEAQVVRPYVVSTWDHVAVPEAELIEYMAALASEPQSAPLIQHLQIVFEVLYKKREYAVLVRHLEEAVARRPDVFAFHRTLGKAYHDILDFGNAVEELVHARTLQPEHHEVTIELSRALGGAKRWPDAVVLLEAELQKHDEPEVRKGLAIALMESGEKERARVLLRELAASYPADLDIMRAQDRLDKK